VPGTYTITARRVGFAPLLQRVTVLQSVELTLVLTPSALELEPLTVTATRTASSPLSSPLPATALAGDRLRQVGGISLAQALDGLPGMRTLSTGEQVGKPILRGLSGPRVLVLDNGLRLEDYSWSDEDGPSVDPRVADRIEVIRGPASVLYGSDAVGGVINVIPADVPDARGRASFVHGSVELDGGTNNGEVEAPVSVEGASGALGWRATLIGRVAGDFHTPPGNDSTPSGQLFNTGYHAVNGEFALGVHGSRSGGTVRYEHYGGNFGLLDGPPVATDDSLGPLRKLSDDRVQVTSSRLIGGGGLRLETKSQWQRHTLTEVVDQSRVGDEEPTFELRLTTLTTDVLLHHARGSWLSGTLGMSGLYQSNQSDGQFPLVPGGRTSGAALFVSEQTTFGRWSLLVGARADVRDVSSDANAALRLSPHEHTISALTGDAGAVFRPATGLALAANVGRAFRAPTLFELYTNGPHLGENRYEIGLPDARPELSFNVDVSVRWQRGRFAGELSSYRNQINNYLYVQPTGSQVTITTEEGDQATLPLYRFAQTARAVLWGVDAGVDVAAVPALTLRGRLDYVRGTNRAAGEPLPLMPPLRADLGAELHTTGIAERGRAYLSIGTQLVATQTRLGSFDTQTPAYSLLQVGAGVSRTVGGRTLALSLRVTNLTNTRYTDFLSRYKLFAYGQGRNLVARLATEF